MPQRQSGANPTTVILALFCTSDAAGFFADNSDVQLSLQLNPPREEAVPLLHEHDFLRIADLAHRTFGLDLRADKRSVVAARLACVLRELGLTSFRQYCDYLLSDRTGIALATLADRLTTNYTSFFREPAHFDFLRSTVLPALRSRWRINIWSAGCSSGEEAYSIAISVLEAAPHLVPRLRIHATDISTRMLRRASLAIYSADRILAIPAALRERHLVPSESPSTFRIAPHARAFVDFGRLNLMDPFPAVRYSVIFCRNVMLYFDRPTQQSLIERLVAHLEPGGFLFIGHTESFSGICHTLEPGAPAVYRKPARAAAHAASLVGVSPTRSLRCARSPLMQLALKAEEVYA